MKFQTGLLELGLDYIVGIQPNISVWTDGNLPADTSIDDLARQAKLRWRIERDYLELNQELGLGHDEGRGWHGLTMQRWRQGSISAWPHSADRRPAPRLRRACVRAA